MRRKTTISYGAVQNKAGKFLKADLASVSAAAAAAAQNMPADYRVSITDASAEDAYPISTFTWLLGLPEAPAGDEGPYSQRLPWLDAQRR